MYLFDFEYFFVTIDSDEYYCVQKPVWQRKSGRHCGSRTDSDDNQHISSVSVLQNKGSYKMNYTFILKCKDGSLYTGWTNNLEKRVKDHNDGKGAKYTKSRRPVTLVYHEEFETKEEAMRREYAIKQMTRAEKEKLVLYNKDKSK